ncbi:asialoglycoprotein receptor 2 [Sorex fumeus]|uniref:asialoglycoprotein receptor 2 n=1 Tax=Sorex fumeus TaxID=62283 RepID=UPI0024ADAC77|nr:asialoglycoprotein receptor 2 [Sorex fumeus]XP_055971107.1 asialoglycoprotein receptor 2 [Sorex fumeus]XP_055971108.1 asialoglycoprotein receptor 2 [Sorex fumeus]XP_055971109.1 asialoglycoprotein receptor 2 [Sorex fumeus]
MDKDLQDIQQLDPEESNHEIDGGELPSTPERHARRPPPAWKGMFPPQPPLCQRLCSSQSLSLLILGFNVVLLVAICVIASRRAQLQMELWTLKEKFGNFSSSTLMEMESLSFHRGSTGNKVTSLETKLEKLLKELKADHSTLLDHLKHFPVDLRTLTCQMKFFRSNGTECCPVNWIEHEGSCYWFSHTGSTWSEAENYCQLEKAHLVVINSKDEQDFIVQHTNSFNNWIGLTERDGFWKWVDGTDLKYKNMVLHRLDDWRGREVDSSRESCFEIQRNGFWNRDLCLQTHRWVCEMKSNVTS